MPRNAEVVRQWEILRELEASRFGRTIDELAALRGVTTRTIRRDLQALESAGFALYSERREGRTRWRLETQPFRILRDTGFTLGEACALHFSRALSVGAAPPPLADDLRSAFAKIEATWPASLRRFLLRLPAMLVSKPGPMLTRRADPAVLARLVAAMLEHRRIRLHYRSAASGHQKSYDADPYRLVHGEGALYLVARVHDYRQVRTFAVDRVEGITVTDETFEAPADEASEIFQNSLGIHEGPAQPVTVRFAADVAPYVVEREWHASQRLQRRDDGSVDLSLVVSHDRALRRWILSFGAGARVLDPASLARDLASELAGAHRQYADPHARSTRRAPLHPAGTDQRGA